MKPADINLERQDQEWISAHGDRPELDEILADAKERYILPATETDDTDNNSEPDTLEEETIATRSNNAKQSKKTVFEL